MEAEARYAWVGAMVLALVGALVAGVVWLKNVGGQGDYRRYAIHFEHQALNGLDIGAEVALRGIKIGRVEDYALSVDKFNRVRVAIRVDARSPVRANTVAVVTRNIVTGIAAIALVTPEPPGEPLVAVPEGESLPVIREGRSDLDEIAGRVNQIGEMASVALANINQLLSTENRADAMAAVRSVRDLAAGLNKRLGALDRTLARTSDAAERFGSAATQLGDAGQRIAGVTEQLGGRLDGTLVQTEQTLADARRALQRLDASIDAVQAQTVATARKLEDTASQVDDQLATAVAELRSSSEAAARVLDRLRDPRAALLGASPSQLGPGERPR